MNKVSFLGVIVADGCNPNGDPLGDNMPRQDYDGYGLISPDCLKRKLRNRVAAMGNEIFCQNGDTVGHDEFRSLSERAKAHLNLSVPTEEIMKDACARWYDTRTFGQVIGIAAKKSKTDEPGSGVALGIRGPVSISYARSLDVLTPQRIELVTSALQSERQKGTKTFAHHYVISKAAYVFTGGIWPQLAERTGFDETDAQTLHEALKTMYDGDASWARPEGSIVLHRLLWWTHDCSFGSVNPARLFRSVDIQPLDVYPYYTLKFTEDFPRLSLDDFTI